MNSIHITMASFAPSFSVRFSIPKSDKTLFTEMLTSFKSALKTRKFDGLDKIWYVDISEEEALKKWCMNSIFWDQIVWKGEYLKGKSESEWTEEFNFGKDKDDKNNNNSSKSSSKFDDFINLVPASHKQIYYAKLYLNENSSKEEMTKRWKLLMTLFHPDKKNLENGCAEEITRQINEAYQFIKKSNGW